VKKSSKFEAGYLNNEEESHMSDAVELLINAQCLVGEGPIWDDEKQVLYWVDILNSTLFIYDPATAENRAFNIGQHVGTVVPRASGGLLLAVRDGFAFFDPDTQELTMIDDPEAHLPGNRFNDGKCDPAGRFWAGTMAYDNPTDQGSLYRLDADFSVHKMLDNIGISNGIAWSLDHSTMYFIDSIRYTVRAFDYDIETGDIAGERVVIHVPKEVGLPDGMAIDSDGMLWVAHFGGSQVCRWSPESGKILETIMLPVSCVTACAFGGANLDTLFITSASHVLDEEDLDHEPHAGGLFAVKPGYRGVPAFRFAG
jgi:sugar lactone lactonase YvrE